MVIQRCSCHLSISAFTEQCIIIIINIYKTDYQHKHKPIISKHVKGGGGQSDTLTSVSNRQVPSPNQNRLLCHLTSIARKTGKSGNLDVANITTPVNSNDRPTSLFHVKSFHALDVCRKSKSWTHKRTSTSVRYMRNFGIHLPKKITQLNLFNYL